MSLTSRPSLSKHARFGFQLQAQEGVEISDDVIWVPFTDTLDFFDIVANMEVFRQADYTGYDHLMFSAGQWFDGNAPMGLFPLTPVATVLTPLVDWIQSRDVYNQGEFATVFLRDEQGIRSVVDTKVAEATVTVTKGRPITFVLRLVGKSPGTDTPSASPYTGGPYIWQDGVIQVDFSPYGAGVLATDQEFESLEIRIDNVVEDAGEGLRITSGFNPRRLYNLSGIRATGTATRDYIDSNLYNQFLLQIADTFGTTADAALSLTLSRGGAQILFNLPRVRWTAVRQVAPGDNESRRITNVDFTALGSDIGDPPTGASPPITLTESDV